MPRINLIQNRAGTAAQWTTANPVLALAEIGLETDSRRAKVGDGTTAWATLAYSFENASPLAITSTSVVANQAAMLALTNQDQGDIAVRSDTNQTFILTATPASTLANWQLMPSPSAIVMTGATASVAGAAGYVPAPAIGDQARFLTGAGTWAAPTAAAVMTGATAGAAGTGGTVPVPAAGDHVRFLPGAGTFTADPVMVGATASVAGVAGNVPAAAIGQQAFFLTGGGTYTNAINGGTP